MIKCEFKDKDKNNDLPIKISRYFIFNDIYFYYSAATNKPAMIAGLMKCGSS